MDVTKDVFSTAIPSVESANKVLKNTYLLLSMTLLFSAAVAMLSLMLALPHPGLVITLVGYFGLLYLTNRYKNSVGGIVAVFGLTGFMGYTLGPILGAYLTVAPNIVVQSLFSTAVIFLSLSLYAVKTKKDFSFLSSFLFVGILVAFLAGLGAIFFSMPALSLTVSVLFVLLMSGLILYQTGEIVNGGETNYVMATVTLFVSLFNLFTSMLHLLGFMQSE